MNCQLTIAFTTVLTCGPLHAGSLNLGGNIDAWGKTGQGLQLRAVAVNASMSEDNISLDTPVSVFADRFGVAFAVEVRNMTDQTISLPDTRYGNSYGKHKGKANSNWLSQFLFSIDDLDKDGELIRRADVHVVDLNMPLSGALVSEIAPGKTHKFLIRPAKWMRVMDQPRSAGHHTAVIRYHGVPEPVAARLKEYSPKNELLQCWSGNIASEPVSFEIEKPADEFQEASLVWGKPHNGLQAAVGYSTGTPIHRHGDKIDLELHVRNVSQEQISVSSHMWLSDLPLTGKRVSGEKVEITHTWYSGWTLSTRVTLQPGQSTCYNAGNLAIAGTKAQAEEFEHVTNRRLVAESGSYRIQFAAEFRGSILKDGQGKVLAPLEGDWQGKLTTGAAPLVILEHETSANQPDNVLSPQ